MDVLDSAFRLPKTISEDALFASAELYSWAKRHELNKGCEGQLQWPAFLTSLSVAKEWLSELVEVRIAGVGEGEGSNSQHLRSFPLSASVESVLIAVQERFHFPPNGFLLKVSFAVPPASADLLHFERRMFGIAVAFLRCSAAMIS